MGFTCALPVTSKAVVSYTAFPPLPAQNAQAVYFCCTGLGVTSTGRYPASCPMKPGLSSPAAFRHLQPRLSVLLNTVFNYTKKSLCCPLFSRFSSWFLLISYCSHDVRPATHLAILNRLWRWGEMHSSQNTHPPCQSAEWLTREWTVTSEVLFRCRIPHCHSFLNRYFPLHLSFIICSFII